MGRILLQVTVSNIEFFGFSLVTTLVLISWYLEGTASNIFPTKVAI